MSTTCWIDDGEGEPIDPHPFAATGEDICGEDLRDDAGLIHLCDRDPGHAGRHMCLAFEDGEFVVAAWPGDHAPTEEDI